MRILQIELGILTFTVVGMFVLVMHDSWITFMKDRELRDFHKKGKK